MERRLQKRGIDLLSSVISADNSKDDEPLELNTDFKFSKNRALDKTNSSKRAKSHRSCGAAEVQIITAQDAAALLQQAKSAELSKKKRKLTK